MGEDGAVPEETGGKQSRERRRGRDEGGALRGLVGAGPSRVGVSGALRARDVSRPSEADEAAATAMPVPRVGPPVTGPPRPKQRPGPRPGEPRTPAAPDQAGSGGNDPSAS